MRIRVTATALLLVAAIHVREPYLQLIARANEIVLLGTQLRLLLDQLVRMIGAVLGIILNYQNRGVIPIRTV